MQQQTIQDDGPQRGGLLRRIFPDFTSAPAVPAPAAAAVRTARVVEARPIRNPDLESIALRIDRLEQGTRLLAETVKRAFAQMAAAVDEARLESSRATTAGVDAAVAQRLEPVVTSLEQLSRAVERFPQILAMSTDAVMGQVERSTNRAQENVIHVLASAASGAPVSGDDALAPQRFDVEPLEESAPRSEERVSWAAREAAAIWGSP